MSAVANKLSIQNGEFKLREIDFEIPTCSCTAITGNSGVGKTTLLEGICGLKPITSGQLLIDHEPVQDSPPWERNIGLVPQEIALFNHMTVKQHLEFAPRIRKWPVDKRESQVARLLDVLGLEQLRDRRPGQLSGGQGQRLAIARAVSFEPKLLCLDEPFSWLDREAAAEIAEFIQLLKTEFSATILLVSHRIEDLESIADSTFSFRGGRLEKSK